MFTLVKRNETVTGGFRYLVPETNKWMPDPATHGASSMFTLQDLLDVVRAHYLGNNLAVPGNLQALVEDQICRSLPPKWCRDEKGRQLRGKGLADFSWQTVARGTRALASFLLAGRQRVPDSEAVRRSNICKRCHFHRDPKECKSCGGETLFSVAKAVVGGVTLPSDQGLKACAVCGCGLVAAVRVPLEILNDGVPVEESEMWPEWCWRRG